MSKPSRLATETVPAAPAKMPVVLAQAAVPVPVLSVQLVLAAFQMPVPPLTTLSACGPVPSQYRMPPVLTMRLTWLCTERSSAKLPSA